jgi:hypothetical protein
LIKRLSDAGIQIFSRLIANMQMVFYVLDLDWTFSLSEGQGLITLGLKPGEVVGLSAYEMYKGQADIIEAIKEAFLGKTVKMNHVLGEFISGKGIHHFY